MCTRAPAYPGGVGTSFMWGRVQHVDCWPVVSTVVRVRHGGGGCMRVDRSSRGIVHGAPHLFRREVHHAWWHPLVASVTVHLGVCHRNTGHVGLRMRRVLLRVLCVQWQMPRLPPHPTTRYRVRCDVAGDGRRPRHVAFCACAVQVVPWVPAHMVGLVPVLLLAVLLHVVFAGVFFVDAHRLALGAFVDDLAVRFLVLGPRGCVFEAVRACTTLVDTQRHQFPHHLRYFTISVWKDTAGN